MGITAIVVAITGTFGAAGGPAASVLPKDEETLKNG